MSSNFRYFLYKHRTKIIIGVAATLILLAILAVVLLMFQGDSDVTEFETKVEYANYYLVGNKTEVAVYNTLGEKCGSTSYDNVVYPNNLSNTMIIFANNKFMEISAYEKMSGCGIKETLLLNYERKRVSEFYWTDTHLAIKRETGGFEIYNRDTKKSVYLSEIEDVDEFIAIGNYFVYSVADTIVSVDLKTKTSVEINVGADTYELSAFGDKVIAYNKFGNGNNTTTLFVLKPSDLYIENLLVENTKNVYPISSDNTCFIRKANNIAFVKVSETGKLNSTTLNLKLGANEFTENNTLFYKDYLYSTKDGYLTIISIKNKLLQHTINICGEYFSPIYIEK